MDHYDDGMDHHGPMDDDFGLDEAAMSDDNLADHGLDGSAWDVSDPAGWTDSPGWAGGLPPFGADPEDEFDAGLPSVDPVDLSLAEDYAGYQPDVAEALGGDLWPGLPAAHLDGVAAGVGASFGADPDQFPLADFGADGSGIGLDTVAGLDLGLDLPRPVDGFPWIDVDVLGDDLLPARDDQLDDQRGDHSGEPDAAELFEYAAEQPPASGDGWTVLLASDDPATSALARWWLTSA